MWAGRAGWPPTRRPAAAGERALGLARDAATPSRAYAAAEELVAAAEAEARLLTADRNEAETEELRTALGAGGTGKGTAGALRGATGAIKDLERRQKSRQTRASRDALDRALIDLATYFRDALLVSAGAGRGAGQPSGHGRPGGRDGRARARRSGCCAASKRCWSAGRRWPSTSSRSSPSTPWSPPSVRRCAIDAWDAREPAVDSCRPSGHAALAQSVERLTRNE